MEENSSNSSRIGLLIGAAIGVILLTVVIVLGYFSYTDSKISANDLVVTNVTDTALSITWVSDDAYVGKIYYQESSKSWPVIFAQSGKDVAYDDRDVELSEDGVYVQVEDGVKTRYTHHVTLRNLKPETEYSFRVGGRLNGLEGEVNKYTTKALIEDIKTPDPAYGKIEGVNNADSVVIFTNKKNTEESDARVSVPVSDQGTYSLDAQFFGVKDVKGKDFIVSVRNETRSNITVPAFTKDTYKPLDTIVVGESSSSSNLNSNLLGNVLAQAVEGQPGGVACTSGATCTQGSCYTGPSDGDGKVDCYCGDNRVVRDVTLNNNVATATCTGSTVDSGNDGNTGSNSSGETTTGSGSGSVYTCASNPCGGAVCDAGLDNNVVICYPNNVAVCVYPNGDQANLPTSLNGCVEGPMSKGDYDSYYNGVVDSSIQASVEQATVQQESNAAETQEFEQIPTAQGGTVQVLKTECGTDSSKRILKDNGLFIGDLNDVVICEKQGVEYYQCKDSQNSMVNPDSKGYLCSVAVPVVPGVAPTNLSDQILATDTYLLSRRSIAFANREVSGNNTSYTSGGNSTGYVYYSSNCVNIYETENSSYISSTGGVGSAASKYEPTANFNNALSQINSSNQTYVSKVDMEIYFQHTDCGNDPSSDLSPWTLVELTSSIDLNHLLSTASAQSATPRGQVLQAATGSDSLEVTESGRYAVFNDNERVAEKDVIVSGDSVEVRLFTDTDGDGQKDETEEYFSDYSQVRLAKEASAESYTLSAGWNLINIPMVDTRSEGTIRTAGDLIDYWNDQGADIKHVARFVNGQFQMFSKRESGTEYSTDFDLIPGQGLFVLNLATSSNVTFSGNKFEEGVPLELSSGWNLVGIAGSQQSYTTETFLIKMEESGVEADTISQFENGLYQSVVKEEGTVFGNNFNLIEKRGYFIRTENGGNVTP